MKVIPVIDVLDGVVVHALRGERKIYKPLQSVLVQSSDPISVARAFDGLGFGSLYLADLNAIMGKGDNFVAIDRIVKGTDLEVVVDAGVANIERAKILLGLGVSNVVVGTETLTDVGNVDRMVRVLGADSIVISLDLNHGKLLAKFPLDSFAGPMAVLPEFQRMGVKRVIVLDLARVGSGEGVDLGFLSEVLKSGGLDVFVGGGVRDVADLVALEKLGVAGVLVATALHSGRMAVEEIVAGGLDVV